MLPLAISSNDAAMQPAESSAAPEYLCAACQAGCRGATQTDRQRLSNAMSIESWEKHQGVPSDLWACDGKSEEDGDTIHRSNPQNDVPY